MAGPSGPSIVSPQRDVTKKVSFTIEEDFPKGTSLGIIGKDFRLMRQLGLDTMRTSFAWDDFEPAPGKYDFSWLKKVLRLAQENGIKLRPYIAYIPGWVPCRPLLRDLQRGGFPAMVGRDCQRIRPDATRGSPRRAGGGPAPAGPPRWHDIPRYRLAPGDHQGGSCELLRRHALPRLSGDLGPRYGRELPGRALPQQVHPVRRASEVWPQAYLDQRDGICHN
jgi:hypothetical protein